MKGIIQKTEAIKRFLIHPSYIRISIFNILACVGCVVSLAVFFVSLCNGADFLNLVTLFSAGSFSAVLLAFAKKTGHYRASYLITVILIFMILFPVMFFTAGGLFSGMPVYFALAVSFTVFMLENKLGLITSTLEIAEYVICGLVSIRYPQTVIPFGSAEAAAFDIISGVVVCSTALGITLCLQTRLYRSQQKKTEDALSEVSRQSQAKDVF